MKPKIHITILSIVLLGANLSSAQETNKFVSMPDGTKVVVLQEYASSYMVTREGEHKPFFLEKNTSAAVSPTPAQIATNNAVANPEVKGIAWHFADFSNSPLSSGRVLTSEESKKYTAAMQIVIKDPAVIKERGKGDAYVAALQAAAIKADPSLSKAYDKMNNYKPWEYPDNPLSVLTPEQGEMFVAVASKAAKSPNVTKALVASASGGTPASRAEALKEFHALLDAEMIKINPDVAPLLDKVIAFTPPAASK